MRGRGRPAETEAVIKQTMLYIGGRWRHAASEATFDTVNPATGQALGRCAQAGAADADEAVAAALRAWNGVLPAERARLLWRVADLIEGHCEELAALETADQGQLLSVAREVSVRGAAEHFRYYAGWAAKIEGETVPPATVPMVFQYTRREPVGACALITP